MTVDRAAETYPTGWNCRSLAWRLLYADSHAGSGTGLIAEGAVLGIKETVGPSSTVSTMPTASPTTPSTTP
jgi:hypothetical protein